jgi:hypothetical protein
MDAVTGHEDMSGSSHVTSEKSSGNPADAVLVKRTKVEISTMEIIDLMGVLIGQARCS